MTARPQVLARRLARLAFRSGLDGVVCSPVEISGIRRALFGSAEGHARDRGFCLVVPGIRPVVPQSGTDDQRRVATARAAVRVGADYLVIGRPILEAPDPLVAIRRIARELG